MKDFRLIYVVERRTKYKYVLRLLVLIKPNALQILTEIYTSYLDLTYTGHHNLFLRTSPRTQQPLFNTISKNRAVNKPNMPRTSYTISRAS